MEVISAKLFLLLRVLRCYTKLLFTMLTHHVLQLYSILFNVGEYLCNVSATASFLQVFV